VFERFTEGARQVVVLAQEESRALGHDYIGTEHILLGLVREEEGLAAGVLASVGLSVEWVRAQVVGVVGSGEEMTSGQIPLTPPARSVLAAAAQESRALGHDHVRTEHILLGLLREKDGVVVRILLDRGVDLADLREEVIVRAGGSGARLVDEPTSSGPGPAIDPGWLDGLPVLLKVLGDEIRSDLGRPPDLGDLLLALILVPGTLAAEALGELGIDVDGLWAGIERARARARAEERTLATRLREAVVAKELAIEEGRFQEAAALRDRERELRQEARATQRTRLETIGELRRRLGIAHQPDER
jgi:Clp amino terminal domain, pathogenicity island component